VNKNDLIQKLSEHSGLDKNTSARAVDGVFELIASALKAGDEVRLTGAWRLLVVVVVPVQQDHDVGILLDRSTFT